MSPFVRRAFFMILFSSVSLGIVYYQTSKTTLADQEKDKLPDIGGPFSLTDHHGKARTQEDFKGKYTLVYFGYSYCPDICPMGLTHMSQALKLIKEDRDKVAIIFITVDPERDTVELLSDYSRNYDPNILFLTGSKEAIESAKKHYKVYASRTDTATSTDYLMDHSTLIYLMDRDGRFLDHFPHTVAPTVLADHLTKLLAKDHIQR